MHVRIWGKVLANPSLASEALTMNAGVAGRFSLLDGSTSIRTSCSAVMAEAEHICMRMRGVRNEAKMTTSAFRGIYENKGEKESIITMIRKRPSENLKF